MTKPATERMRFLAMLFGMANKVSRGGAHEAQ
jgi:hypothetical protein